MKNKGDFYLDVENKFSIRFSYKTSATIRNGIISTNKLKGYSLDNCGNVLSKGIVNLAWSDNDDRVDEWDINLLIGKILETSKNDVKPLIQSIYKIHNQRHQLISSNQAETINEEEELAHQRYIRENGFTEEDHYSESLEFFKWKDQGWE
jgi:hypothetical protein